MLASGASITDIAQVLGHSEPESTQRYISVSVDMLRECALEVTP
jgi:site-specific recombinase XerD